MSNVAYLVTQENVTISRDGKTLMVNRQYADFQGVVQKLKDRDFDAAFELADKAVSLTKQSNGVFTVKNGVVYQDGLPVHNVVTDRIIQFQEQGLPFEPLVMFLKNLLSNPSERSIKELYKFLENKFLPITKDGCFLSYKAVRADFSSITSGATQVRVSKDGGKTFETFTGHVPNEVGNIVEVDRKDVDDDANVTCSFGLHTGAIEYVNSFAKHDSKKVIVKINPKDAVSVPVDDNAQKLRVSRYEVVAELVNVVKKPLAPKSVSTRADSSKTVIGRQMTLVLASNGEFTKADVRMAVGVIQKAARKHFKLRNDVSSKGFELTDGGSTLTINLNIPLDSRYKQPEPDEFMAMWQQGIQSKFNLTKALLK